MKAIEKIRGAGWEIVKQIGRKIISGNFNLTKISFPIKCMVPKSNLENTCLAASYAPLYFNKAAMIKNKLERMKLIATFCVCCNYGGDLGKMYFMKPVNPTWGETLEAGF